ncbi:hypothetical protein SY89_03518 [Halolamina pelagica]|uniref:Uncharacterized protein n=1 Tax=Halolamina pelagica TaxID=699431 RepID=A0A0P7HY23_9EURY|nr:hypothetical protein SY89_03138 [Halolamina pelagica]KPN29284.1 hypothetical protein SY89_03518 [Halolamina pelagica]
MAAECGKHVVFPDGEFGRDRSEVEELSIRLSCPDGVVAIECRVERRDVGGEEDVRLRFEQFRKLFVLGFDALDAARELREFGVVDAE